MIKRREKEYFMILFFKCIILAFFLVIPFAYSESGSDRFELTKGEWLRLQLQLDNPAQATIEDHGCRISYHWYPPNTIVIELIHIKKLNQQACQLNLEFAKTFANKKANAYGWKWVKISEERRTLD